ncbi:uncharacterized protein LOC119095042 [Pollicipes pollicipes]|uniref:uncharacterized protein LOC119095042 n=1 Tax=Pollicipes pollicipes TaxID=41117 RepID=UPI0018850C09|nr:uncharacterized protein LOC119095042 [Pollicipes pollicipes]
MYDEKALKFDIPAINRLDHPKLVRGNRGRRNHVDLTHSLVAKGALQGTNANEAARYRYHSLNTAMRYYDVMEDGRRAHAVQWALLKSANKYYGVASSSEDSADEDEQQFEEQATTSAVEQMEEGRHPFMSLSRSRRSPSSKNNGHTELLLDISHLQHGQRMETILDVAPPGHGAQDGYGGPDMTPCSDGPGPVGPFEDVPEHTIRVVSGLETYLRMLKLTVTEASALWCYLSVSRRCKALVSQLARWAGDFGRWWWNGSGTPPTSVSGSAIRSGWSATATFSNGAPHSKDEDQAQERDARLQRQKGARGADAEPPGGPEHRRSCVVPPRPTTGFRAGTGNDTALLADYDAQLAEYRGQVEQRHGVPTFAEFLDFVLASEPTGDTFDSHWTPYWRQCAPCHMGYDVIGMLETGADDFKYMWHRMKIYSSVRIPRQNALQRNSTALEEHARRYLAPVHPATVARLGHRFRLDFELFGYDWEQMLRLSGHCAATGRCVLA